MGCDRPGHLGQFQSLTGSTGHLAAQTTFWPNHSRRVSIPNGLHRPFSREAYKLIPAHIRVSTPNRPTSPFIPHTAASPLRFFYLFQPLTASTCSLPPHLPIPIPVFLGVSIPNGLHRPFSQRRRSFNGNFSLCFNP